MTTDQALLILAEIKLYYDVIDCPKYRNIDLADFKKHYDKLCDLKPALESNVILSCLDLQANIQIHQKN